MFPFLMKVALRLPDFPQAEHNSMVKGKKQAGRGDSVEYA